ncbi:MAG: DUF3467 domain-containing protein [bacterium]
MENKNNKELKIQIRGNDSVLGGTYANNLMIHMTREEFVLDFINLVPPHASLNARIVVSPGHFRRMIEAMKQTVDRFEKEFGALPATPAQTSPTELVQ